MPSDQSICLSERLTRQKADAQVLLQEAEIVDKLLIHLG